jgi:hypothetical protein
MSNLPRNKRKVSISRARGVLPNNNDQLSNDEDKYLGPVLVRFDADAIQSLSLNNARL